MSVKAVLERVAAKDPRYAPLAEQMTEPTRIQALVKRALPCISLGKVVERRGCVCRRNDLHQCDAGHGEVCQSGACETCDDYVADD